jgi:hypothetical protein
MRRLETKALGLLRIASITALFGIPVVALGASWEQTAPGAVEAFQKGDLKAVKEVLELNNFYRDDPQIAVQGLHLAVMSGNVALVKYLDSLGWLDDCRAREDCRLISAAAEKGRIKIIKLLMSRGFDVKLVDRGGATALFEAARRGHFETVKFLCDQGVDPSARLLESSGGYTALELARIDYQGRGQLDPNYREATRIRAELPRVIEYLESGQCKRK